MYLGSVTAIENSVMKSMYPELINVPTDFVDKMDINIEVILKLDPDVVIYLADYKNQYDVMTEAGITAVGVTTQAKGNALKTIESQLKVIGKTFGTDTENGNAAKALEYGVQVQEEIVEVVNKIIQEDKPNVLYLYGHSEDEIRASGQDFYGGFWIESSGGINVAYEIIGQFVVNIEQIYKWNPNVILITAMTETTAEDILNNYIEGKDWSQFEAVKNGKKFMCFPLVSTFK